MERKTMTADEIRKQFNVSKQALTNYLNLGVLTPVSGTENSDNPLYYADEAAVIREALTSCRSSINTLNTIHSNILKEVKKANSSLAVLQLDETMKDGVVHGIVDSIMLFLERAVPNLGETKYPFYWIRNMEGKELKRIMSQMLEVPSRRTPQDFCEKLYHEVEVCDVSSLTHVLEERDALEKENERLKEEIEALKNKVDVLTPDSRNFLARKGYVNQLTDKQVEGLKKDLFDFDFSVRVLNCLKSELMYNDKEMTVMNLVPYTLSEMKKFRNFGKNSANEIVEKLAAYDLTLGMEVVEVDGKYYSKQSDN